MSTERIGGVWHGGKSPPARVCTSACFRVDARYTAVLLSNNKHYSDVVTQEIIKDTNDKLETVCEEDRIKKRHTGSRTAEDLYNRAGMSLT